MMRTESSQKSSGLSAAMQMKRSLRNSARSFASALRSLAIPKVVEMASEPALRDALLSGYGQFDLEGKDALVQALTGTPGRVDT